MPTPGRLTSSRPGDLRAAVADVARAVADDLLRERAGRVVGLDRREPAVHRDERLVGVVHVAHQRDRAEPDHVVGGRPVLALEPRADRPRAVGVVERARIGPAQVDDRDPVEVVRAVHRAAAVGAGERGLVGAAALRASG